jgi:hypothetical protein
MALDVIKPMGPGELPNLGRLALEGCSGPLETLWPTNSSLLWTTIATGRHHRDHGIDDFWYYRRGRRKLGQTAVRKGARWKKKIIRALNALGLVPLRFFDSRDVRAKTFWDIVAEAGGRVGVVNWWHTWPVAPTNGFVVSDRLVYWRDAIDKGRAPAQTRLVFPEELFDPVRKLILAPDDVTAAEMRGYVKVQDDEMREFVEADFAMNKLRGELRFFISADRSCSRILERCLDEYRDLQVAAVYLRGPDIAQHCAFQFTPWARESKASDEDRERFGGAVPAAYRLADELLGKVLDRMGPEDSILVLSDHGVAYIDERRGYGHRYGEPPGVLYAWGREFEHGLEIRGASVYDVTPTVLRLCGLPTDRGMQGRALEELLTEEFRREHPPLEPIPDYGPRCPAGGDVTEPPQVTKDIEKHLRGLGYFD